MMECVPKQEITDRITRFQHILRQDKIDGALVLHNVDIYYFSGTA